jgi:Na+-driven multidrug efflux pump
MATQMIGPISGAIITRLLASHGQAVVAGFGVAGRIEAVAVMLLFALSGSIGPFVGQNWGAGELDRVRAGMRVAYRFSLAWGFIAWLALLLFGSRLVPLIDDSPDVVAAARHYLAIVPFSYGLWGVLMMASAAFNSLGKPIPSTVMAFTRMFVIYVPLAMLADHLFGYSGIFVATAAANCVMGCWGYVWFKRNVFGSGRGSLATA